MQIPFLFFRHRIILLSLPFISVSIFYSHLLFHASLFFLLGLLFAFSVFFCSVSSFAPVMLFSSSCIFADTFFAQGFGFNCIFPSLFFCHLPETVETRASAAPSGAAAELTLPCSEEEQMKKMNDAKDHSTASVMVLEDFFGWITKCCRKTNMFNNFHTIKRWNRSINSSVAATFWGSFTEHKLRHFSSNPGFFLRLMFDSYSCCLATIKHSC